MAYSYECERDGDKGIQRLFGCVRRTAASPRTVDSPSMTLAQLVRTRRGHNLPRQAASFDVHQTDTGPANYWNHNSSLRFRVHRRMEMATDFRTAHHPRW